MIVIFVGRDANLKSMMCIVWRIWGYERLLVNKKFVDKRRQKRLGVMMKALSRDLSVDMGWIIGAGIVGSTIVVHSSSFLVKWPW